MGERVGVHARPPRAAAGGCRAPIDDRRAPSATGRGRSPWRTWPRTHRTTGAATVRGSARTRPRPRTRWCLRCPEPPRSRSEGRKAQPGRSGSAARPPAPATAGAMFRARAPPRARRPAPARTFVGPLPNLPSAGLSWSGIRMLVTRPDARLAIEDYPPAPGTSPHRARGAGPT